MSGRAKKTKQWTAAGAARAARDARIATVEYQREAPTARLWTAQKLLLSFQTKYEHLRRDTDERTARSMAWSLLFTGLGYPPSWMPGDLREAAETVVADEARYLGEAELYVLSPQMRDVVVAAAQTLTADDLALLTAEDLPSPSGLLVLPSPLLVRAVNGNLGDDRAYLWNSPIAMPKPDPTTSGWGQAEAVRTSLYHDTHGPVRPDSFLEFAAEARAQGHPLPPLLLDATRCFPFEPTFTDEQKRNLDAFLAVAESTGDRVRERTRAHGYDEDRVIGEYTPGQEIHDPDDSFTLRFLYAFWRLCAQRIATTTPAENRHSARVAADRAGVSTDVRIVQLRPTAAADNDTGDDGESRWHHHWVVRMHKVRQWYPTEQRHKVIYRGPYIKGPQDKPLLGGEVVRSLN